MKYLIGILLVFLSSAFAQDCQSSVKNVSVQDSDRMAVEERQGIVPRYTYNAAQMKCVSYMEGDPNLRANSFESQEECRGNCSRSFYVNCTAPKDSGPCREGHKRFYYNTTSLTCEEFTYGGCRGNGNNFEALYLCEDFCVPHPIDCQSAVKNLSAQGFDRLTKEEKEKSVEKYTYNAAEMKCEKYLEGDRNLRANSYATEGNCRVRCSRKYKLDCTSPKDRGPCREPHKSFYYNTASSTCEEFAYGGCQGNGNNYPDLAHCKYFCQPPFCYHPKVVGNCSESHKRYFYDIFKGECKEFVYSGCGGNTNNFETLELCKKECKHL